MPEEDTGFKKSLSAGFTPGVMAAAFTGLFILAAVVFALTAKYPYTDDSVYHYLIARYAPSHPALFVSVWGKPAFTLLHALPAQAGYIGSRLFSIALTMFVACLTALAARAGGYGRSVSEGACGKGGGGRIWLLAMPLCLFNPQLFTLSFNPHAETIYAALLAGALLAYFRRRFFTASVLISLGVTARPEGFFLLILFAGAWFFQFIIKKPQNLRGFLIAWLLLAAGPVVWTVAANVLEGRFDPFWLYHANPYPVTTPQEYGAGGAAHFILLSPIILGMFLLPFLIIGVVVEIRRRRYLPLLIVVSFWVLQTFLYAFRLFASGGYPRFFAAIAPATALLTLAGLNAVIGRSSRFRPSSNPRGVTLPVLVLLLSAVFAGACYACTTLFPFSLDRKYEAMKGVNTEFRRHVARHGMPPALVSEDAYIYFLNDIDPFDWKFRGRMSKDYLSIAPEGTVVLWYRGPYSPAPGVEEGCFSENGYELLTRTDNGQRFVRLYVKR